MQNKIKSRRQIRELSRQARREGRRVVFTNGCFDLLHAGHVRYLEAARAEGDLLIVGLNSDSSVRRLKGPGRPLNPAADRAEVLAGLQAVDAVVIFGKDTPAELIAELKPEVLVKGADWAEGEIVGADTVQRRGGKVVRIPLLEGRSTSRMIQAIRRPKRR
jgi:rfaE bifunctional protein nucleotidyltransferase chain/domain